MREILHFESTAERLRYLKNGYEEIEPIEVPKAEKKLSKSEEKPSEGISDGEKAEEKPKKKRKSKKKPEGEQTDEVSAE